MTVRRRLVLSSALMLFLELALIRWSGANIVHLSYFTNFVLLGSFLGIGLGFLRAKPDRKPPYYSPVVLALLVAFVLAFPVQVNQNDQQVIYFTSLKTSGPPIWVTLPLVFLATAVVLMGPAELVSGCFLELERLEAYRYDLLGSLLGTAAFTALSYLKAPSLAWGSIVAVLYLTLLWRYEPGAPPWRRLPARLRNAAPLRRLPHRVSPAVARASLCAAAAVVVTLLAIETFSPNVLWSPYYKVRMAVRTNGADTSRYISVNGVPHQRVTNAQLREHQEPQYAWPYERTKGNPLNDVLIVGAGSGSDVAIALRHGAKHVDAVEIDPTLLGIGREYNPDHAYADPRVTTHVDDGRAFLERTDKKYDLILFALPDSLTLVQGASSLRLESYLFTEEALRSVREHLKPGGAFAMYNYYRERWLVDRYAATVQEAFGHAPCVDIAKTTGHQAVITAGLTPADQHCASRFAPVASASVPAPASDDWPFPYLKQRSLPKLYLITLLLVLLASAVAVRAVAGPLRRMRPYADMFLLGSAFLLLETKSITGFALLFGTTWVVNALVFTGVLIAVLAAVEVTRRLSTPPVPVMYALLGGALLLAWLVPNEWLLSLPVPLRAVTAIGVAFLPIFCANVVFAKRFTSTPDPTTAFGANLLGSMVGGCLEYVALLVGYHGLLVLAALLYGGAFLLLPRDARTATAT